MQLRYYPFLLSRIFPQLGSGGCTPRPRKERPDSISIAPATPKVAATNTGERAFGRICLNMSLLSLAPTALAALNKIPFL